MLYEIDCCYTSVMSLFPFQGATTAAVPGYGFIPTAATTARADSLTAAANAAAAAAGYFTDFATASPAAGVASIAANAAAIPRSDPSPIPLSSSPISQRTAGTTTTHNELL